MKKELSMTMKKLIAKAEVYEEDDDAAGALFYVCIANYNSFINECNKDKKESNE